MNSIPRPDQASHTTDLLDPDQHRKPEEGWQRKDGKRRVAARLLGFAAVAAVAGLVGFGVWSKSSRDADAEAALQTRLNSVPIVRTMIVKATDAPRRIELTGNM